MAEPELNQPQSADSPVRLTPKDDPAAPLKDGIALCLSGGGYRAMMFHLGALWRLNELGYLGKLDRVSSVSGGSITAGVLGLHWDELGITAGAPAPGFGMVVDEVRKMAGETIDIGSVLEGVFGPGTVSDKIQRAYDDLLFHGATLQKLPDKPRFVINATNVQSAVLWRFSKPYMRDWRVGEVRNPQIPLALAVAASSAFPPVLSPCEIDLKAYGCVFEPGSGVDLQMGTLHLQSGPDGWRRVRQSGARDGLEAVQDDPGQRRRRAHRAGTETAPRLGPALVSRSGDHRQPGAQLARAASDRAIPEGRTRRGVLGNPDRTSRTTASPTRCLVRPTRPRRSRLFRPG